MDDLCVLSCVECEELARENEGNKLAIARLSESKVWGVYSVWVCMGRCVFVGGCGCCTALTRKSSLQIPPLTEALDEKKARKWV